MDFHCIQKSEQLKSFKKCGFIYKSSSLNEKSNILLTCFDCDEIFCKLEMFFEHLAAHLPSAAMSEGLVCEPEIKNQTESAYALLEPNGMGLIDPLEAENKEPFNSSPDGSIVDKTKVLPFFKLLVSEKNYICDCREEDIDLELVKISKSDSEVDDYSDKKRINTVQENRKEKTQLKDEPDRSKFNLKLYMKNRSFIKCIIKAFKQQELLWDTKSKYDSHSIKTQCLKAIAQDVHHNMEINLTTKQIDLVIRRLRKLFASQYRQKEGEKKESCGHKLFWFYDQLKFLEPHIRIKKKKTNICNQLTFEQFQLLIKLLRENECLWNEENIYHTSLFYKAKLLKDIAETYFSAHKEHELSVNDIRDAIEELKDIVVNKNKQQVDCSNMDPVCSTLYEQQHRFYKDLAFLEPHVGPFRCSKCSKNFEDIYAYKFHTSKHEGTKAFKCMICHKELTHKKGFMCHLRRHTKECPYKCGLCDKSFPSRKERQRHVIKHGSKPYVCELCANTFYTQHQLTNHMKNHANIRDHVCTQCGKGFTHRGLLRQHLQTHNKTECICSLCNNVYANPRSLRKHYLRVHEAASQETSAPNRSCQVCMITFSSLHEAKQHRKEHSQSLGVKRKHICDVCGHDFAYPRNLADHKKIHSNIRDQVCDECGKAFTNINLLNQHKNVHNRKKFVCNVCGKDYAHYRGLCRHINKAHKTYSNDASSTGEKQQERKNPTKTDVMVSCTLVSSGP